jgi:hypothetical protein
MLSKLLPAKVETASLASGEIPFVRENAHIRSGGEYEAPANPAKRAIVEKS